MNVADFNKLIKKKGQHQELVVYPYGSDELKSHATVVVLSDQVLGVEDVIARRKVIATVVQMYSKPQISFELHKDEILKRQKVAASYFSVYTLKDEKLFEFRAE